MRRETRVLLLALVAGLLGTAAVVGLASSSAVAHPCVESSREHVHEDGGVHVHVEATEDEDEHECIIIDESSEIYEAVDTTDAAADPLDPAVASFVYSDNMEPLGYSARNVPFSGAGSAQFNSDLGFKDNLVYQGTYDGFRIVDVSNPAAPVQVVNYLGCSSAAGQGDVLVYGNLLIRSWDSPVSNANAAVASCGGQLVGQGFEGVHIFDISNPASPVMIKQVRMSTNGTNGPNAPAITGCGSHTATLVPDASRGNLYVYSSGSSGTCTGIDVIRIPLSSPTDAQWLRRAAASRQCHDIAAFLATVNLAACAGGNGFSVFRFDPELGADAPGGIANPTLLYSKSMGVTTAHSHSFSWDGKILIFGHEPGGGSAAQCQATSSLLNRTLFFMDPLTGAELGRFVQPRPQTNRENCTWHNFNVVPTNRAHIAVVGSYQMGITVIDFTDPANAQQIAYADPAPLSTTQTILGGDWSTYWHNGLIYESDIRRGTIIWKLDDRRVEGAKTFALSNPQTQTIRFDLDRTKPTITHSIPASIGLGKTVPATFSCADLGSETNPETSGIFSCTIDAGSNLDSSAVGTKTITIRAEDGAGNVQTLVLTYEVIWDQFEGFYPPVSKLGDKTVQAGSAVPVKFSLGADYGLAVLAAGYPMSKVCGASDSTAVATVATEPLSFADGQYSYVWKTDKAYAGECRELIVKLADNTVRRVEIVFKG